VFTWGTEIISTTCFYSGVFLSFPLDGNLLYPLFVKEGIEEILWRIDLFKKSPSIPLFQRRKDILEDAG